MKNDSKLVLFDWGGVVDNTCFDTKYNFWQLMIDALRYATNVSHKTDDEAIMRIFNSGYIKTMTGPSDDYQFKVQIREYFVGIGDIKTLYDAHYAAERFIHYTLEHYKYIPYYADIVQLMYDTKERCLVGLMSDHNWLEAHRLDAQIDTSRLDCEFRSYYLGVDKASGKLFDVVDEMVDVKSENILLIDDNKDNCAMANSHGWKSYRCKENDYIGISNAINLFLR